jgi:RNA polymerase sigma-70 factor (ECF subfamily)
MSPPRSGAVPDTPWTVLRSVQAGSAEGWDYIVSLYAPVVARWCRRAGLQEADADDILQDVFLSVSRHLATFSRDRGSGRFRSWLCSITRSRLADRGRRQGREPPAIGGDARPLDAVAAPEAQEELDPTFRNLELRRALDLVRSEVAATTWDAFWQTVVEGRPTADVAAALDLSLGKVRLAKFRVLHRLRGLLE